ncbi:MAG: SDR family NAD(P)-dependent oxidoreductase [Anaerolineae bacterium]|nr:SDR family NAD(P)-dependent oxidoreductase [Anaerolineae bacterium]
MEKWTAEHMPDQNGRTALVTGSNSGLGYECALALARKNAQVVMAIRNVQKGEEAHRNILAEVPNARLEILPLDLGNLESVRQAAATFLEQHAHLHILINNAGIMAIPRQETKDGFETQFGVNHLGHFALTGLLLPALLNTPGARVVNVTSTAQYMGNIPFDDLMGKQSYGRWSAYGQSKLANVLFTFELQRRLERANARVISVVAHPGFAESNLRSTTNAHSGGGLEQVIFNVADRLIAQPGSQGAWPMLYAATAPGVQGGEHYEPHFLKTRGYPVKNPAVKRAYDEQVAARLWQVSEELTGVQYGALAAAPAQSSSVMA